jgi:hypothetical protein
MARSLPSQPASICPFTKEQFPLKKIHSSADIFQGEKNPLAPYTFTSALKLEVPSVPMEMRHFPTHNLMYNGGSVSEKEGAKLLKRNSK